MLGVVFVRVSFATVKINILYADGSFLDCLSDLYEFVPENICMLHGMGFVFETFNHVKLSKEAVLALYGSICNGPDIPSSLDCLVVS